MLFLQKSISFTSFNRAARELDVQAARAMAVYKVILDANIIDNYNKVPKQSSSVDFICLFLGLGATKFRAGPKMH